MKNVNNIFLNYPTIDLHGFDRDSAVVIVKDFIRENSKLGNNKLVIIHGIGEGILKKSIHEYLKTDKMISDYKLDNFNLGVTIVELR